MHLQLKMTKFILAETIMTGTFIMTVVNFWQDAKGWILFGLSILYVIYKIRDLQVKIDGTILDNIKKSRELKLEKKEIRKERVVYYKKSSLNWMKKFVNWTRNTLRRKN